MATPAPPLPAAAEAARYALLRRLAPSMRHHLVVNLQPIGMIYEVMDRRLRAAEPNLAQVQESAGKINGFAKAALASCIDVIGWLAPDDAAAATPGEVVRECCGLLATSLSFRGYALRNEVPEVGGTVRRSAIRTLLSAALLHLADSRPAPGEITLHGAAEADGARVTVAFQPVPADRPHMAAELNYRAIAWEDLEALAAAEGVPVAREGERIVLHFPWTAGP
jgi:hypothetical protein